MVIVTRFFYYAKLEQLFDSVKNLLESGFLQNYLKEKTLIN